MFLEDTVLSTDPNGYEIWDISYADLLRANREVRQGDRHSVELNEMIGEFVQKGKWDDEQVRMTLLFDLIDDEVRLEDCSRDSYGRHCA